MSQFAERPYSLMRENFIIDYFIEKCDEAFKSFGSSLHMIKLVLLLSFKKFLYYQIWSLTTLNFARLAAYENPSVTGQDELVAGHTFSSTRL